MPRKEYEGQPLHGAGKMSEETRKEVFEKGERRAPPDSREGTTRQYSGGSESGHRPAPSHSGRRTG